MQFGSLKQEKAAALVQGQINPPYLSQCAFMWGYIIFFADTKQSQVKVTKLIEKIVAKKKKKNSKQHWLVTCSLITGMIYTGFDD